MWPAAAWSAQRPLTAHSTATSARAACEALNRDAAAQAPAAPMTAMPVTSTRIATLIGRSRYAGRNGETTMVSDSTYPHAGKPPHAKGSQPGSSW